MTELDLREHTSTWGEPIGIDYRGVRATTHPPNSSGVIALETPRHPGAVRAAPPTAFGPAGVDGPRLDPRSGSRRPKLALADRDRYLTDPEARDVPVADLLDPARLADIAARIDPSRTAEPAAAANPPASATPSTWRPSMARATR